MKIFRHGFVIISFASLSAVLLSNNTEKAWKSNLKALFLKLVKELNSSC